jgi:hypothetical protein
VRVVLVLPSRSALRRRAWGRPVEMLQCHLCGILLGIVDMLSIVPESSRDVLALNGDRAGPRSASAYPIVSQLVFPDSFMKKVAHLFDQT